MKKVPSWIQAVLVLLVATIVLFAVGESAHESKVIGYLAYGLYTLIIVLGCFFIISRNLKSIWYVPFICNATSVISAIIEPNFWRTLLWIPNVVGWVLTLVVTYLAWKKGKRRDSRTRL
jgi:hypothetical protein